MLIQNENFIRLHSIKVCAHAKLDTNVYGWILNRCALSISSRLAYLGDKTSQFRGNDTEDHGRRIICIVLRDNSFIVDDCSGRCTYSHGLVNINVLPILRQLVLVCIDNLRVLNI